MAGIVVSDGYNYLFDDCVHPLTKDWYLTGNPIRILTILATYQIFCKRLGPWLMKDRKPFELKLIMKIYNLFQVFISLYIFGVGLTYVSSDFNFNCQNLDDPSTDRAKWIADQIWIFLIVKITDFLDTVFFVLRKSDRQITSLHLHHHTIMPFVSWMAITYYPGGQGAIIGFINAFVHAVMYTYYFIAGLGEEYKKYLWWKKYVTIIQLIQFSIFLIHSINSFFHSCGYPFSLKLLQFFYAILFLKMFGQFYYNTYIVKKPSKQKKEKELADKNSLSNKMRKEESEKSR